MNRRLDKGYLHTSIFIKALCSEGLPTKAKEDHFQNKIKLNALDPTPYDVSQQQYFY